MEGEPTDGRILILTLYFKFLLSLYNAKKKTIGTVSGSKRFLGLGEQRKTKEWHFARAKLGREPK